MSALKLELRNVKYAAFASEETSCFEATVYVDGKKEGQASNDGRGGMTWVEPQALRERLNAYGETLPPLDVGDGLRVDQDAETLIDNLLQAFLVERDFNRIIKRIVMRMPDSKPGQFTQFNAAYKPTPENLAAVAAKYPQAVILNTLPRDEALRVYRGQA